MQNQVAIFRFGHSRSHIRVGSDFRDSETTTRHRIRLLAAIVAAPGIRESLCVDRLDALMASVK